jgi:hypothetical protein
MLALAVATLAFASISAQAALIVSAGTGQIGNGVTFTQFSDGFFSYFFAAGGTFHSPSGGPDMFFRATDMPTFPGALGIYAEAALTDFAGGWQSWEGSMDGTDNWMKVIRDGDGAVSWAQLTFDFSNFPNAAIVDAPLFVYSDDGADFSLAQAVAAAANGGSGSSIPEAQTLGLFGLGLVGLGIAARRRKTA